MIKNLKTENIRNIAIIAHVDHGKTTLINELLKQSGILDSHKALADRVMDNQDLEQERGITISAKCTAVYWEDKKINIVDTPGHADFGGEVERVLSMVDGVILLVDAAEGVMPQTKFVVSKALPLGIKPIVVINKIDRKDERIKEVIDEVFELFVNLGADDDQLDFPLLYASGRDGYALTNPDHEKKGDLKPMFNCIINTVPQPRIPDQKEGEFSFLATILSNDNFMGRVLTGKLYKGPMKNSAVAKSLNVSSEMIERGKITRIQTFYGIDKVTIEEAVAGDIITVSGLPNTNVSDTICNEGCNAAIPSYAIDPPTMSVSISVNTSPFAGKSGDKLTSGKIRERLLKEQENNVAISVRESESKDSFEVGGRGELQLGVLLETMRREGYELSVSKPRVIFKNDEDGKKLEPFEDAVIDVDEEYSGAVVEKLTQRRGELVNMTPGVGGKSRIVFNIPSRGLIGYRSEFLTDTRGTGVLNRVFESYKPYKGEIAGYKNGALISTETGVASGYGLFNLQDRGIMFVKPQDKVYQGMIVGEHNRDSDLEINVTKSKQLTNVRASGSDENIKLSPPKILTLEEAISYVRDDEMIEVTPDEIRLRKIMLDPNDRKRASRKK